MNDRYGVIVIMAYGLRVKKADGTVILNTPDMAGRIRYSNVVAAGASSSTVLSDIAGKTVYAFSIPLEENKLAHSVSISGTTFSWTAQTASSPPLSFASSQSIVGVIIVD